MKKTKVTLVPLTADDREQFILDNQWAFKYGALMEFGERDDHIDDGEIISRATIEKSIDDPKSETYRIVLGLSMDFSMVAREMISPSSSIWSSRLPNSIIAPYLNAH